MVLRKSVLVAALICAVLVGSAVDAVAKKKKKQMDAEAVPSVPESQIAATVGERTITLEDIDARARAADPQPYQALYDARRAMLDNMIAEALIEQEAGARGITKEALTVQEIEQKAVPVLDEDIEKFYEQNNSRMGGRTLDEMKEPIRNHLTNLTRQQVATSFLNALKEKTAVSVRIEPPRLQIEIAENDPGRGGPPDAPVQIIEFSDFQCPYCSRVNPALKQILDTYGDKVRIVFMDLPLPMHQLAHGAAQAAQCANEAGKFWEFHDKLFENQGALKPENLKGYAAELGLDTVTFNACLDSGKYREAVDADMRKAEQAGVSGTPGFLVNGRLLKGAQPLEAFRRIIDDELQRAGVQQASAATP